MVRKFSGIWNFEVLSFTHIHPNIPILELRVPVFPQYCLILAIRANQRDPAEVNLKATAIAHLMALTVSTLRLQEKKDSFKPAVKVFSFSIFL